METLREQVRQTILTGRFVHPGDRVLVGVSGGPDSVALVHLLAGLKDTLRVRLSVVHVDHSLRPDSARDAAFVEELARQLGLPATIVKRDVLTEAKRLGLSLEDAARRIRYAVFLEAARTQSANRLALGHTADDQAETVIMRMVRGSGLTGLTAIPMTRSLGELVIIRPLLDVWRKDLLAYLTAHRLAFRADPTNEEPRFLRNRIRAELLPLLEREYNSNIKALLNQLAEQCRTDVAYLQDAAERQWKRLVKPQDGGLAIRIGAFLRQPKALQRQLMRLVIQRLQGDLSRFEFRHWLEIERLFTERPVGTVLDLPEQVRLERAADRVIVRLPAPSAARQAGVSVPPPVILE